MAKNTKSTIPIDTKKQINDDILRWYVLSVVSWQELIVIENLRERVKKQDLHDDVTDFLVPTINQTYMRKGQKVIKEKKLYPGYVFIKSKMNDKIRYIVRNTPWVRIIVGAETHPIPLTEREYKNIIQQIKASNERSELVVPYKVGDVVLMKSWDFKGMKWAIREIDVDKWYAVVNMEMLGRLTPVMLDFDKIELIS